MWEIDGDCRSFVKSVILQSHVEPVFTDIFQFLFPMGQWVRKIQIFQRHLGGQNDPIIPILTGKGSVFPARTAEVHP